MMQMSTGQESGKRPVVKRRTDPKAAACRTIAVAVKAPKDKGTGLPVEQVRVEWRRGNETGGGLWFERTEKVEAALRDTVASLCEKHGADSHWMAARVD